MRNAILALLALTLLTACANTREGISRDAQRMGDRMQAVSQDLSEP